MKIKRRDDALGLLPEIKRLVYRFVLFFMNNDTKQNKTKQNKTKR